MAANPGRNAGQPRRPPRHASTVGWMKRENTLVRAFCRKCDYKNMDVDIGAIVDVVGENFSLIDFHPPCKVPGCDGRILFMYQGHGRMIPCKT